MSDLAAAIRAHRLALGLSLGELADRAGVSRSTLVKIEGGSTPDPRWSVVRALVTAAALPPTVLLKLLREAPATQVTGIGYEGRSVTELLGALQATRIEMVVDVRLTPISRKAGLSKTALRNSLGAAGIGYLHLPALGNLKDNRAGYADQDDEAPRDRFRARLRDPAAQDGLAIIRRTARARRVALLCFEADGRLCHRAQVLEALG